MEGAFGADLGHVRVHDGSDAVVLNERLGARAFTSGRDIFFSGAVPDTTTRDGVELLAHELTHTVQQGATPVSRAIRRQEEESSVASSEEAPVVGGISASAFAVARTDVGGRST